MPRLFENKKCTVCSGSHDFWFALDSIAGSTRYTFTCPKKDRDGEINLELSDGRVVSGRPGDAVEAFMVAPRR